MVRTHEVDVLIVGSGSAGLAAATWLSIYGIPAYNPDAINNDGTDQKPTTGGVAIIDKRSGPLLQGQADGVQCRTVEVFESFGLSEDLLKEAYHVLEVSFWEDQHDGRGMKRVRNAEDTKKGLSWMPHVILNQARVNGLMLEKVRGESGYGVGYGRECRGMLEVGNEEEGGKVVVRTERVVEGGKVEEEVWKARYVLGCDGAHSAVRKGLGFKMVGDTTDAVWGVMDVYPRTDFPDIRKKVTLHCDEGVLLIIPREGGELARFYIAMPEGTKASDVKAEHLHELARKIFGAGGFQMEIAGTFWWSAYSIGQRLADGFSMKNRVFLTGDACHTHSPKAGQGMNVSLQDGYNIGWKLGMVLTGQADASLLKTYDRERGKVAADLVEFDRNWTKAISGKQKNGESGASFSDRFLQAAKYMAGLTARYDDSNVMAASSSNQELAKSIVVGMRFPSSQVVRLCDAKAMQLAKALKADGKWRIVIFAGDVSGEDGKKRLDSLGEYLDSATGPIRTCTATGQDVDTAIEPIVVLSGNRLQTDQTAFHPIFWPTTGKWKMRDLHKVFVDEESYNSGHGYIYESCMVDPVQGAVVIVRPDQYVSKVTSMDDFDGIGAFFKTFMRLSNKDGLSNGH